MTTTCKLVTSISKERVFRYVTCDQEEIAWIQRRCGSDARIFDYPTYRDLPWITIARSLAIGACVSVVGICVGMWAYRIHKSEDTPKT